MTLNHEEKIEEKIEIEQENENETDSDNDNDNDIVLENINPKQQIKYEKKDMKSENIETEDAIEWDEFIKSEGFKKSPKTPK